MVLTITPSSLENLLKSSKSGPEYAGNGRRFATGRSAHSIVLDT
jgi:hypothetical protein